MSKKIQQSATVVKKKGRSRTPTSILVFELDDKSVEHILGDNKSRLLTSLYEKMRAGCKLLFISKQDSVLNRLKQEIPFSIETHLLKEKNQNKIKEDLIKMILQNVTDRIKPQTSAYIGTLFSKDDVNSQSFKFGTVTNPYAYFTSISHMKPSSNTEETTTNALSPMKTEDPDFDHKEISGIDSKNSSAAQRPFDNSHPSSQRKSIYLNGESHDQNHKQEDLSPEKHQYPGHEVQKQKQSKQIYLRKELPSQYYTKIKDLNNRISCKLSLKLDQFKVKPNYFDHETYIKSPKSLPLSSPADNEDSSSSQLGKRRRNFEDDVFNDYLTNIANNLHVAADDDIFDTSCQIKSSVDLMSKLQNINFEVTDEADSRPIMKKLKTSEIKGGKSNCGQIGADEAVLKYRVAVPGERQTTIEVYERDLQRLEPNCYINDTIIQFYLKLVQCEFIDDSHKSQIYIYNTYLIEKLRGNKGEKGDMEDSGFEKIYNSVKKWTKDVDIFEKDFLFFPMHDKTQKHWSLFVVCYPKYFLVKEEPTENTESVSFTRPFLLYFDSFATMDTNIAKLIALYLEYEVMHKKPEIYNEIKHNFNGIKEENMHQVIVPLQDNLSDCGLYLLEYAERFMTDPDKILENIEENRDKLHLFPRSIFKTKRTDIANLILGLAKGNREVLKEYQIQKEQRLKAAFNDPEEFEEIGEEELEEFLQSEFNVTLSEFDAASRDRLKLTYFLQMHEQKLPTMGSSNKIQ